MKYFPFFFKLDIQDCLIIGGGDVAERKADLLIKAKAKITLVAPKISDYILGLEKEKKLDNVLKKLDSMSSKVVKMSNDLSSLNLEKNQLSLNKK